MNSPVHTLYRSLSGKALYVCRLSLSCSHLFLLLNFETIFSRFLFRSVLVLKGNGADVAKHCVPAVPTKRYFLMNESISRPIKIFFSTINA